MNKFEFKILKVDLTSESVSTYTVPQEDAFNYIGGRGLGAKLLWDNQTAGIDPLSEKSMMLLLTGPLTGLAPGGAQMCVVAKSPQTKITMIHSLTGAQFPVELKLAGFDGIWLTGRAKEPSYLYVYNDKVEIKSAKKYWGLNSFETQKSIKEDLKDNKTKIVCIGQAGENLVKFASIQQEYFRAAARGGTGAIMGSKNLKAIAVRGTGALDAFDYEQFISVRKKAYDKFMPETKAVRRGYVFGRYGSIIGQITTHDISECSVRNYREGYWEDIDKVSGIVFERRLKVKSRGCFSCPIGCMQLGKIKEGEWEGKIVSPDFDSSGTIGPNLLLNSIEESSYLSRLGDVYGLDDASMGNVLGFVTECYEKGLITKEDLGGIEVGFGKAEEYIKLIDMIVKREGFGNIMAEGVRHMSEFIGNGSEFFAMHAKGLEYAGYAPHAHHNRALQYAVGDRGGCHHYGLTVTDQNMRAVLDSLACCTWNFGYITPDMYMDMLNAVTGFGYKQSDWGILGDRIIMMCRVYNIREGMVPLRDDILPGRLYEEPQSWGPKAGSLYPKEKFEADRARWYKERGCNESGIPTIDTLKTLGMDFSIDGMKYII